VSVLFFCRPDFAIECDASDPALAGIVVRAPGDVTAGGRFWRRLDAREATWSPCLREMAGYEFSFATLSETHDLRDKALEIVGDHRAASFIFANGGSQCMDEGPGALLITDVMLRILNRPDTPQCHVSVLQACSVRFPCKCGLRPLRAGRLRGRGTAPATPLQLVFGRGRICEIRVSFPLSSF